MEEFEKYYEMYGSMYIKQLELESEAKMDAEEALRNMLDNAISNSTVGATKIGERLIDMSWDSCRENIKALIAEANHPKRGVEPKHVALLKELLAIYPSDQENLINCLTLTTINTLLGHVFGDDNTISQIAKIICDDVLHEVNIDKFVQWSSTTDNPVTMSGSKLAKSIMRGLDVRVQESYKKTYITNRMHQEGFHEEIKWSNEQQAHFGSKLIEMALKGSGFFVTGTKKVNGKQMATIEASDWLTATWEKNADIMAKYASKFIPTIIPPKPWDSVEGCGYYGELQTFAQLLRQKHITDTSYIKQYQEKLATVNLDVIYGALNAMQSTAFIINKQMLDVINQIIESGGCLGGLPQTEPYATLPELPEPYTEDELEEHKRKMVGIIHKEQARKSHCMRNMMTLATAKKFAKYDKIYYTWNMDYRGRCYPMCTSLSPQGDDIAKSLLLFAEPTPCKHKDDYRWLAIHGANLAGHDKINFNDRVQWVLDNETNIIASADDPIGYTWWSKEAENDYPLEFLAWCFEWKRLLEYTKKNGSCVGLKCGIAVAFDGTCSGLQHFSALLRDEIGGHAVNLTPTDKVQDIYSIVADKVNVVLKKDAMSGTADSYKTDKAGNQLHDKKGNALPKYGTKSLAQSWLNFAADKYKSDGITRKVCKRSVMTLAYGSKKFGFKENLTTDIIRPYMIEHPDDSAFLSPNQAALYMADLIWNAVKATVVKAVEGMEFLQQLAEIICKSGRVVTWVTPNGLPVQQNYMVCSVKTYEIRINGVKKRFYMSSHSGDIDVRGQQQGIAPNFIHSMDATHMQRVVVASHKSGNHNFQMIHDSFGTDMANAGDLFRIIREQFVELYANHNYLEDFLKDVSYLIDDDAESIPEIPSFGSLKIADVINSDFCFA